MDKMLIEYTKEDLIVEIKKLKKQKKFGLVWEDRPEQVVKDVETKLPVLTEVEDRKIQRGSDHNEPTHLLIEGDNYHSLSVLNYTHAGKIDVIYIDPPYNTGNKDFIYNDRFVDKEDTFRHSKWLSFMSRRLELAKDLLAETGVIFISIDDNEQAHLKLLCDQIFGEENFIDTIMVELSGTSGMKVGAAKKGQIVKNGEFVQVYARDKSRLGTVKRKPLYDPVFGYDTHYSYYMDTDGSLVEFSKVLYRDPDIRSVFDAFGVVSRDQSYSVKLLDEYIDKSPIIRDFVFKKSDRIVRTYSAIPKVPESLASTLSRGTYQEFHNGTRSYYLSRDGQNQIIQLVPLEMSLRQTDDRIGTYGRSVIRGDFWKGFSIDMGNIAKEGGVDFKNGKKPVRLIEQILKWATGENVNAIILDFFAGSGTTGHAVLKLNREDGGNREFILCTNNESGIAENVTHRRIKKVIEGYDAIEGIPANVRYFKTDFVEKEKSTDATRAKLVERAADMIRVREGNYDEIARTNDYILYGNDEKLTAVIFEPFKMAAIWQEIKAHNPNDLTVDLYLFSFTRDTTAFTDEIPDSNWRSCPIPESILETYVKIFKKGKKK